ncbi:MAG: hypothetical protein ABJL57_11845 [Hyphomonas sp.]|uniref:hypothetical protein n=1 Tax=Hyphomonas sp. TaxID=87 RepID=UPI0032677521
MKTVLKLIRVFTGPRYRVRNCQRQQKDGLFGTWRPVMARGVWKLSADDAAAAMGELAKASAGLADGWPVTMMGVDLGGQDCSVTALWIDGNLVYRCGVPPAHNRLKVLRPLTKKLRKETA